MPSVLLVCTANICRSPMSEAILKRLVASRPDANQWHIESAGTWAGSGNRPAPLSQFVMQTMGMDISDHRSQPVSVELLQNFDIILTMESSQKEGMRIQFADIAERIYMLSEMVGVNEDIADPIGGELEDYMVTAHEIQRMLTDGLDRINEIALSR